MSRSDLLQIRYRGSGVFRGSFEGLTKPSRVELCLRRKGFRDLCEGFEGLARAYTCERGARRGGWAVST